MSFTARLRFLTPALIGATTLIVGGCPIQEQGLLAEYSGLVANDQIAQKLSPTESDALSGATSGPAAATNGSTQGRPFDQGPVIGDTLPVDDATAQASPLPPSGSTPNRPTLTGTWMLEAGEMFKDFDASLRTTALLLDADGTGRIFFRDLSTNAIDCMRLFHVSNGETLVLDLAAEPAASFSPNRSTTFPVVTLGPETLGLADEFGRVAFFSKQDVLPAEITCQELEVRAIYDVPTPNSFSDLVLFNGDLIFNSLDGNIEQFDLETRTLNPPPAPTNSRFVQTSQGSTFWSHCGCGGSPDAFRRTFSNVVDTVRTDLDLGVDITIRAAAYVPTTDRLWLHGSDGSVNWFLVANTAVEPDVLDEQFLFNRNVRALSFDGSSLWAIVRVGTQTIARLDPETGRAVESFDLPDDDIFWTGLTFDAFNMYMVGITPDGDGVLYEFPRLSLPSPVNPQVN